jgi:outer membrane protein assembly factor BamB
MAFRSLVCLVIIIAGALAQQAIPTIAPPVLAWQSRVNDTSPTNPVFSPNNDVVFFGGSQGVYAFQAATGNALGQVQFPQLFQLGQQTYPITHQPPTGPALLYVGINTTVYAYTADGQFTLKWQYDAITQVTGVLSAHSATLAVANMDGHVSAVDAATGTLTWVVSLNYATEQPPGPVAGFGNVYVALNDTLIAIDAEQGTGNWNASVAYPIAMSAVLNNVLDGVVSIAYTAGSGSPIMVRGFNAKTGAMLWDTNSAVISEVYSTLSSFFASGEFVNVQTSQTATPYNTAINASNGVVVWFGPSAIASADADAEWLFTVSTYTQAQLNSSLVGTEQGSGYMDYSVTIPNSLVQCNSMLGHVSQSAVAGTTRRLVVSGCTSSGTPNAQTSLIWGFYLPLRQSMTVSQCTDLKCSEGCQDVTYQERCTPQQWDSAATMYSMWEMRTCTASEMDIIKTEGMYGGGSPVSLKSQFVNQCVIDEATKRSSMVTKCG